MNGEQREKHPQPVAKASEIYWITLISCNQSNRNVSTFLLVGGGPAGCTLPVLMPHFCKSGLSNECALALSCSSFSIYNCLCESRTKITAAPKKPQNKTKKTKQTKKKKQNPSRKARIRWIIQLDISIAPYLRFLLLIFHL